MIRIEWTARAFLVLETLPQTIAFDIIRLVDLLPKFPEMGAKIDSLFQSLKAYRQIIVKSKYRVIYDFDEIENRIYILAIQNCRQRLPSTRDLKRKDSDEE